MVCYVDVSDDPDTVLAAISAAASGRPKPVVASIVRSDGQLPTRCTPGVPNYLSRTRQPSSTPAARSARTAS